MLYPKLQIGNPDGDDKPNKKLQTFNHTSRLKVLRGTIYNVKRCTLYPKRQFLFN